MLATLEGKKYFILGNLKQELPVNFIIIINIIIII
jgi:hypothetical protein